LVDVQCLTKRAPNAGALRVPPASRQVIFYTLSFFRSDGVPPSAPARASPKGDLRKPLARSLKVHMNTSKQNYTVENSNESIKFKASFKKLWVDIISVGIEILVFLVLVVYAIFNMSIPAYFVPFLLLIFVLFLIELLWLLYGVEVFEVSKAHIVMKHHIFGFGLSIKFRSNKVNGVFVSHSKINDQFTWQLSNGFKPADFKKGMIAINYGKTLFGIIKTYRFGTNLNEVEAQQIASLVLEKFPQYKYSSTK
jgi:hypothetical protein